MSSNYILKDATEVWLRKKKQKVLRKIVQHKTERIGTKEKAKLILKVHLYSKPLLRYSAKIMDIETRNVSSRYWKEQRFYTCCKCRIVPSPFMFQCTVLLIERHRPLTLQ